MEEATTAMSIRQEGYGYRQLQWQAILQQEVDEDSDATVMMKDDPELDTHLPSDETKVNTRLLGDKLGICKTDQTANATNTYMLFLV
jgi:hypothetical protein